jgi:hypothetical protein
METITVKAQSSSTGVTRMRCATCKRFARLLPGETECSSCLGMLPLSLTLPGDTGSRHEGGERR